MAKRLSVGAAALLALITSKTIVSASEHYTFALVPKNTDSPYFDDALAGCKKAENETDKVVRCLYIGPGRNGGSDEQALIVHDLISNQVDGIAVAPSDVSAVANALRAAGAANIPIVTWYSDLSTKDVGLRAAYVGSDNYQIGIDIAKLVMQKKPKGGVICIQSGSATVANDNERIQGIRDTLAAKASKDAPVARLNGQNGWKEADGCPLLAADDASRADQQMADVLARYTNLDAFVLATALPQLRPALYRETVSKYEGKLASGQLVIVSAGTLPTQLQLLKDGLSSGQVGQRPFEMGYKAMYLLKDLKEGKPAPKDPVVTGLSVCTPGNVGNCAGN
jgi:ribose transport system substrate-binding protein